MWCAGAVARQVPHERGRPPLHRGARPGRPAAPRARARRPRRPLRPAPRRARARRRARPRRPRGKRVLSFYGSSV